MNGCKLRPVNKSKISKELAPAALNKP